MMSLDVQQSAMSTASMRNFVASHVIQTDSLHGITPAHQVLASMKTKKVTTMKNNSSNNGNATTVSIAILAVVLAKVIMLTTTTT